MKKTLEKLWNEYLIDQCSVIDTDKEREATKKASKLHEKLNELLNKEQTEAIEKYIDSLLEIQNLFSRKAFLKGCEFATSFIFEAKNFG